MSELDGNKHRQDLAFKLAVILTLLALFVLSFVWYARGASRTAMYGEPIARAP